MFLKVCAIMIKSNCQKGNFMIENWDHYFTIPKSSHIKNKVLYLFGECGKFWKSCKWLTKNKPILQGNPSILHRYLCVTKVSGVLKRNRENEFKDISVIIVVPNIYIMLYSFQGPTYFSLHHMDHSYQL